ncbi:MAG: hypothetical protein H0T46_26775 [Deltaproteobacteria bacterium]|nr:hypothetical protein [Deltaproteobacteria bacterium]
MLAATTAMASATPALIASSTGNPGALVMDGEGTSSTRIVKIATLTLSTDDGDGLTVSITSGSLTKADGRTPVPFQVVLVASGASAPVSGEFTTPSPTTYTWSNGGTGEVEMDLYIKYTSASLQDPGAYSASVDLVVVDNP